MHRITLTPIDSVYWPVLKKAASQIDSREVERYTQLKRLLSTNKATDRVEFRQRFTSYYGLNAAGLSDAFKNRYFELLFAFVPSATDDAHADLLRELYWIPRRSGDNSLQASFVSKLIAIHDESFPIFDRYVGGFFGLTVPTFGDLEFRIAGFVSNLSAIRARYTSWIQDSNFSQIVRAVTDQHPQLGRCHPIRVCDFLVWTAGKKKLI